MDIMAECEAREVWALSQWVVDKVEGSLSAALRRSESTTNQESARVMEAFMPSSLCLRLHLPKLPISGVAAYQGKNSVQSFASVTRFKREISNDGGNGASSHTHQL